MKRISFNFLLFILFATSLTFGLLACNFNPQKESSSSTIEEVASYSSNEQASLDDSSSTSEENSIFSSSIENDDSSTPPSSDSDSGEITPPVSDSQIEEKPIPESSKAIFILDASASMRTKNEEGSRFERAVNEAMLLGEQSLAEEKILSVILADNHPTVLLRENDASEQTAFFETMWALLENNSQCSYASADMKGAFALAEDLAGDSENVEIVLFTGTNYQNTEGITVIDVSDDQEWNAAVLDAKTSLIDGYYSLEVDVGCYGRDTEILLSVEIFDEYTHSILNTSVICLDNQEMKVVFINQDVYNQETFHQENTVYYLLRDNERFYSYQNIFISVEANDCLSEDNTLSLYDGVKPTLTTQYASASSSSFTISMLHQCRSAFDYLDMQIREVKKDSDPEMEGYDFYLFENKSLDSLPQDGVVFLINPQTEANGFTLGDCATGNFSLSFNNEHAITKNLTNVTLSKYTKITDYDPSFTPIMWVNEDPVCLIKNTEKEKLLLLSFDFAYSNFPITISFPLFMYNVISYYFPQTADKTLVEAGETVTLNSRGESLHIGGYNFDTTLTQFPHEIEFNSVGSYVLKQTLMNETLLQEYVFVKIPQKESAISRTEILPNPDYATVEVALSQNIEQCNIVKVQPLNNRFFLNQLTPLQVFISSTYEGDATLRLYRNGVLENSATVTLANGSQILEINTSFDCYGEYVFTFEIVKTDGTLLTKQENFSSVLTIEKKENILILESIEGESKNLCKLFEEEYSLAVLNIDDAPTDLSQLNSYQQIILVNVANADMPIGFDEILRAFVEELGGSLFTVGGNDENGKANAYNRNDMLGTLYQEMLPVNVINYIPPVGIVFILDVSGSMQNSNDSGISYFDLAKMCCASALDSLTERDFVGIVTLADESTTVLPMTPRTQESTILSAISSLEANGGGTVYASAIQKAATLLLTCEGLAKYHIIMLTDGASSETSYPAIIKENYETHGITLSIVGIGMNRNAPYFADLENAVSLGQGRLYTGTSITSLTSILREELSFPMIGDINYEKSSIAINPEYSSLFNIEAESLPTLDGFYGTKLKEDATAILTGVFGVPIYAQWKYGNGMVGSFMCDLNGIWSRRLLDDANGQALIRALILNNFSMPNFTVTNANNLQNQRETFFFPSQLNDGEKLEIILTDSDNLIVQKLVITNEEDLKNNLSLLVSKTGKYTLSIVKKDQNGKILFEKSYSVCL